MNTPYEIKLMSSFLILIDHAIQMNGGWKNETVRFYPVTSPYSNAYTFTATHKPICNDVSIAGADVLSGVWVGNKYYNVGQSGLQSIYHYRGTLTFTGFNPTGQPISGKGAYKEFQVKITDQTDWKLLFETQYINQLSQQIITGTGLPLDAEITPIVFLRYKGQENKPFGFSKLDNQTLYLRSIVVAETEFQKIAVTSILKNFNMRTVPIVLSTPFTAMGEMTGVNYDYSQLSYDPAFTPIIMSVKAIDVPQHGEYRDIYRNMAIVDFELSTIARS